MSKIEYSDLLFEISKKLDENELPRLIFMCREEIAQGSEGNIRDVLTLFEELEKQNRLGIDRLDTLKEILKQMKKRSLLKKVEEFEIRRKAQSVGIVSSLKRMATYVKGAIKLVCNFRTIAGGLLVVTSGMALRSCSSLDEFVEVFNKVVLVSYSKLAEISEGSLCFTVQAETSSALKELWDMYKSGTLQNRLQEFLVTDEIKLLASGEDVEVTVYIDEREYKEAYLDLMLLQKEESDVTEEARLVGRRRRNSDSFLCFKPNEDDMTLMKLKHTENKWNLERQRRQLLEEEVKNLRREIAVAGQVQMRLFWQEEESAQETEGLERPRERCRRNSDSCLYCKARNKTIAWREGGAVTKHQESEKYEFVQSYLQNIQETHSMTTETSDSGIRTLGEPSDFEMQDSSDHPFQRRFADLDEDVIRKLDRSLKGDSVTVSHIFGSFGITGPLIPAKIFKLFPNTPVKLLKDVLEALQLYDLVELLEKPQPGPSLRPVLPLQEIEELRQSTDPRPSTYHSNVAVLIITGEKNHVTEGIERFFKGLSSKSDVTVLEWKKLSYYECELPSQEAAQNKIWIPLKEARKKRKINEKAVLAVIERWIHNQGNFSMFGVFETLRMYRHGSLEEEWAEIIVKVTTELMTRIPDKIKFFMTSQRIPIMVPHFSEFLSFYDPYGRFLVLRGFESLMLDILNKRWQTLDLISMMEELKRSGYKLGTWAGVSITDRLSSRPRFKKEEDLADCA